MGEQVAAGFIKLRKWGRSSVGRAPALQAGGQEFESLRLHCRNILRRTLKTEYRKSKISYKSKYANMKVMTSKCSGQKVRNR